MFGWFKRKSGSLEPESRWIVTVDDEWIVVRDAAGETRRVGTHDLSGIAVETNDSGPWGTDFWWLLFDGGDQWACAVPQGATGETAMIEYFFTLPGFDHGEMTNAMRSTQNAAFPLWRRPG